MLVQTTSPTISALYLAELLMNTSAKFKMNQTKTVGVVQTNIFKSNQGKLLSNS